MAENTATVNFRQELRRNKPGAEEPDEQTPLIANGSASQSGHGAGDGAGHGNGHGFTNGSATREFFFNKRKTPGLHDPNPFVKYPSHVWHITKVTLLSSEYSVRIDALPTS
jgi:Ca2+:H+ antiporter